MILVGTKSDLEGERQVTYEEAEAVAKEHGMKYYDTSARDNYHVDETMNDLMDQVYEQKFDPEEVQEEDEMSFYTIRLTQKMSTEKDEEKKLQKQNKKCCWEAVKPIEHHQINPSNI